MALKKKILCAALCAAFCVAGLTGCGAAKGAAPPESGVDAVTSAAPSAAVPEESAASSASPEPEATPVQAETPAQTGLAQLNLGDRFLAPRGLDGIDPINDKVVALTFDDGPHPEYTDRLLAILAENDAVATFFVVGTMVENNPEVLQRVYDAGHEIGNHSYDHPNFSKLTADQMTAQYKQTNDLIEGVIGKRALIDRPPGGAMTEEKAAQIGREQTMWTVDPEDWKPEYKNADSIYDNVMNGTNTGIPVRDGAIVLSHDIHAPTIEAYGRIIKELKEQGYKFVTVTQMIQIAELRGKEVAYMFNGAPEPPAQSGDAPPAGSTEAPPAETAALPEERGEALQADA